MSIAIIDYGSGNLRSAEKAFQAAADGRRVQVTADPDIVGQAEHIVLPGVGAFADCIAGLRALPGMLEALDIAVVRGGAPFLGICVGMQLLCRTGLENGRHDGLGWIDGVVAAIPPKANEKIPHMGWNELVLCAAHPVTDGLDGAHMYFVHSYAAQPQDAALVFATTDYGDGFASVIGRDNIIGTQFHPEKSQRAGRHLIENFLRWRP